MSNIASVHQLQSHLSLPQQMLKMAVFGSHFHARIIRLSGGVCVQIVAADLDIQMRLHSEVDRISEKIFEYDAEYIRSNLSYVAQHVRLRTFSEHSSSHFHALKPSASSRGQPCVECHSPQQRGCLLASAEDLSIRLRMLDVRRKTHVVLVTSDCQGKLCLCPIEPHLRNFAPQSSMLLSLTMGCHHASSPKSKAASTSAHAGTSRFPFQIDFAQFCRPQRHLCLWLLTTDQWP